VVSPVALGKVSPPLLRLEAKIADLGAPLEHAPLIVEVVQAGAKSPREPSRAC
jgi:hypothetical protein